MTTEQFGSCVGLSRRRAEEGQVWACTSIENFRTFLRSNIDGI